MKNPLKYFSKVEIAIWSLSVTAIIVSFCVFDRKGYLNLAASLTGVTSLIFIAKGNPIGQVIAIIFSVLYAIISYSYAYYGEMITYVGMSAPMALFALVSWLRHPYKGNRAEVKVGTVSAKEIPLIILLTAAVVTAFYFILRALGTANLIPATASVGTSFLAVYLLFRRSPYYALAYALNDVVLIVLWAFMAAEDISCMSVIICFTAFLVNDVYGFLNWLKIAKRQI